MTMATLAKAVLMRTTPSRQENVSSHRLRLLIDLIARVYNDACTNNNL